MTKLRARWAAAAVWLFALCAIAGGAAAMRATVNASPLVANACYALTVAMIAGAGVFATRATLRQGAEAFFAASLLAAAAAYWLERAASAGAVSAMAANENAWAQAIAAIARVVGVAFGVAYALKSAVLFAGAGLAGAIGGTIVKKRQIAAG